MDKKYRLKKRTKILIYAIQHDIKSNPLKNKRVSILASEAGLDRKLLEAGFKLLFNITVKKYQLMHRMSHSQLMLDEGRFTIKEIAFKCGYASQNSYAKAFKKLFGQTPTDWQYRTEGIEEI